MAAERIGQVYISDTHFGSNIAVPSRPAIQGFLKYLIHNSDGVDGVELLGDIVDVAAVGMDLALEREKETLLLLGELSGRLFERKPRQPRVAYRRGNHDIDANADRFREACGGRIRIHEPAMQRVILRKRVGSRYNATPKHQYHVLYTGFEDRKTMTLCDHGYIYDHYFFENPRKWNWMIRWGENMDNMLKGVNGGRPGDVQKQFEDGFARMFTNRLAQKAAAERTAPVFLSEYEREHHSMPMHWLELAARDAAEYMVCPSGKRYVVRKRVNVAGEGGQRERPLRAVIFGHTHQRPMARPLYDEVRKHRNPIGSAYGNTGCWVNGAGGYIAILDDKMLAYEWAGGSRNLVEEAVLRPL
jgi:UDP-2,3-diacylglucosamine pyrophosphatase LpxH